MNIGIFTDTYYPQINGVVTSTRMLEKELNKLGHRVYIFTTTDPHAPHASPRVFRLPSMPFIFLPTQRVTLLYSPKLLIAIRKLRLDVIHTQTEFPMGIFGKIVSEFYRIPMIHTYHTMYEDYVHYIANGHLITPKGAQRYSRFFCNRAKRVIAPVDKARDYLKEAGVMRPIVTIPTGLDFTLFNRDRFSPEQISQVKKEIGLHPTDPVVVSVGRIAREKSIDVLINQMPALLHRLPNAKLVIVGAGPMLETLRELASKLGISNAVIFTGSKPWDEIGKYYQLGDIFATASTSETQGLTYIEAMAAHIPVVAKKDKSVEGLIHHKLNGYCFEEDGQAADVLYEALTSAEGNKQITDRAFESIQHMSSAHFGKQVEALYMDVTKNQVKKKYSESKN